MPNLFLNLMHSFYLNTLVQLYVYLYSFLLLLSALMAGSSSQLTGVDHSFAASSPLLSVLEIVDAQASLLYRFMTLILVLTRRAS